MFFGKKKDASEAWSRAAGTDARQFPRLGIKTIVDIQTLGKEAHCRLHDLSLGGLAFIAPWEMTPSDPVLIVLPPPEGGGRKRPEPAKIEARVCRAVRSVKHDGWQVGVRFTQVDERARALIRQWFETFGEDAERGAARRR
jgi:hypothetical protein